MGEILFFGKIFCMWQHFLFFVKCHYFFLEILVAVQYCSLFGTSREIRNKIVRNFATEKYHDHPTVQLRDL